MVAKIVSLILFEQSDQRFPFENVDSHGAEIARFFGGADSLKKTLGQSIRLEDFWIFWFFYKLDDFSCGIYFQDPHSCRLFSHYGYGGDGKVGFALLGKFNHRLEIDVVELIAR